VPSGRNFDVAAQFYEDIGFTKEWESEGVAGFTCGSAKFILQNYNVPEFTQHYMLRLNVPDLEAWWDEVDAKKLAEKYGGITMKPPADYPWGREAQIIDAAGVLWHVGKG
jgi:predicted enzyme related to lactoylglutathione lyase